MRGNPGNVTNSAYSYRSIPACAGEPYIKSLAPRCIGVYPRVCGGTVNSYVLKAGDSGLSPRVRGNPPDPEPVAGNLGSIPACAGEPYKWRDIYGSSKVYPRVCGGT